MTKRLPTTKERTWMSIVWMAIDELSDALHDECGGDEERLRSLAQFVDTDKVKTVISRLQTIIGE